jgi:tetratricopeptide (TPR) repeat protein
MHQPPNRGPEEGWDAGDLMPPVRRPPNSHGTPADPAAARQVPDGTAAADASGPISQPSQSRGAAGGVPNRPARPRPMAPTATFGRGAEEVAHALTQAAINLRRGETAQARNVLRALLETQPNSAAAYEALGDVELADRNVAASAIAYRRALELEPGRPTAELKLARAALRGGADKRRATIGVAYAGSDIAAMAPAKSKKNAAIAIVGSLVLPGIGQIVNAQYVKGLIVMALSIFFGAVFFNSIDVPSLNQQVLANLSAMTGKGTATAAPPTLQFPPAVWICMVALIAVWVYSVVDAAVSARGRAER